MAKNVLAHAGIGAHFFVCRRLRTAPAHVGGARWEHFASCATLETGAPMHPFDADNAEDDDRARQQLLEI